MQTPRKPTLSSVTSRVPEPRIQHKTPAAPRASSCMSRMALSEYQSRGPAACKFNSLHTTGKHINNNNDTNLKDVAPKTYQTLELIRARWPYLSRTVSKPQNHSHHQTSQANQISHSNHTNHTNQTNQTNHTNHTNQTYVTNHMTPMTYTNHDKTNTKRTNFDSLLSTNAKSQTKPPQEYKAVVNGETYLVSRQIGTGGSAKVYKGKHRESERIVAVKIINLAKADPRTRQTIFDEQAVLSRLQDCKYVVRVYASEYKPKLNELLIVMELGNYNLAQYIAKRKKIKSTFIQDCWHGMLLAVSEIHERGIVHADLKPENFILVGEDEDQLIIKLIDFGIAHCVDPDQTSLIQDYQMGTINYMAPETLKNDPALRYHRRAFSQMDNTDNEKKNFVKYGSKADIWSLGCILYSFVYGRPPFDKHNNMISKLQAITDPNVKIEYPPRPDNEVLDVMRQCLQYDPEVRPKAEDLLRHPYSSRLWSRDN